MPSYIDQTFVSKKNLIRRINTKLRPKEQKLVTSRSYGEKSNLGAFHTVDCYNNTVLLLNVDLTQYANELGCLGCREELEAN